MLDLEMDAAAQKAYETLMDTPLETLLAKSRVKNVKREFDGDIIKLTVNHRDTFQGRLKVKVQLDPTENRAYLMIQSLMVEREARRIGVATALLDAVSMMSEFTCMEQRLMCSWDNAGALAMYAHAGFEEMPEKAFHGMLMLRRRPCVVRRPNSMRFV